MKNWKKEKKECTISFEHQLVAALQYVTQQLFGDI